MVLLTNVMHASACPLFWWLYDGDTVWHMLSCLQKFSNSTKFVPISEIILLGSTYSENILLHVLLGYMYWTPLHLIYNLERSW